ncbi:hypothetical protein [Nocardia veterana]|uniref:Uncharacterized protein n=1 Tax=Nocardia veterana TaxID=132249 RepID=A0A7X6RKJ3_9NOCA|nr:hypothetical protein [Nocardia veterana]NKY89407.1 hypothetical protein [Nocardia veterana]
MSDHSHVDEIAGEARKFSSAITAALQMYAQAANWRERQRARKQIKRLVREEQREQAQARAHHLTWSNQAVDRYRAHAQAVANRANDPTVDHEHRARDAASLANHRDDLAAQFVSNGHLTRTEQGIALDGLDAATVFPEFKTGDLFNRAHKVKGLEALRYRARVAREKVSVQQRARTERAAWEASLDAAAQTAEQSTGRFSSTVAYLPEGANQVVHEHARHGSEIEAAVWTHNQVSQIRPAPGTSVLVSAYDTDDKGNARPVFRAEGEREAVTDEVSQWWDTTERAATEQDWGRAPEPELTAAQFNAVQRVRDTQAELRQRVRAGRATEWDYRYAQSVTDSAAKHLGPARAAWETDNAEANSRAIVTVSATARDGGTSQSISYFPTEADAAKWTHSHVTETNWKPGVTIAVRAREACQQRPFYITEGNQITVGRDTELWAAETRDGFNSTNTSQARDDHFRSSDPDTVVAERDRLRGELESLSTRHRLSIEHNGDLAEQNARLTRQLSALTAERDELRETNTELVNQLATTNGHTNDHSNGHTNGRESIPGHAFAGLVNGHDREGMER